jgi:hypothetical protein
MKKDGEKNCSGALKKRPDRGKMELLRMGSAAGKRWLL